MVDWVTTSDRRSARDTNREILLLPSRVVTSSGTIVVANSFFKEAVAAVIFLDVTAAATAAGDLLNVYIQKNLATQANPVWTDFASFTQVLGNGGAKQFYSNVTTEDVTAGLGPVQDGALTAGQVSSGPFTAQWRVKWVVVSASAPSFTLSIRCTLPGIKGI